MTGPAHRWAMAVVCDLSEGDAQRLAAMDLPEREERLHELVSSPRAVRGPICEDCRVHWRDVYAQPDKPWPCPGVRPEKLGGPLTSSGDRRGTRQQNRHARRQSVKGAASREQRELDDVRVATQNAITRAARHRNVRAKQLAPFGPLGEALAQAEGLEDYWAVP